MLISFFFIHCGFHLTNLFTISILSTTSGNAATATALQNARTIAGVSFDGTANISLNNNAITSYRNAVRLMTDELVVDHNVLVVPGIRDTLITDFAARRVRDYGKAIYLRNDLPINLLN